ncbi:MAG: helix-turn-helix transcriptional regulator [Planctomycetaceae bacterium]|nr:helix-turn-helix transcriptional regulator [Planctomycetaceae bacterium]
MATRTESETFTERQRQSLDRMAPERRAKLEAIRAEMRTPARRAEEAAVHASYQEDRPGREELIRRGEIDPERGLTMGALVELHRVLAELKRIRASRGLTAAEVSRRAGIAPAAMSRLESGRNANPTFETLARYAAALGADLTLGVRERTPEGAAAESPVESIRGALALALRELDRLDAPNR